MKNKKIYIYIFITAISLIIIFFFSKSFSNSKNTVISEPEPITSLISSSSSQIQLNNDISSIKLPSKVDPQKIEIREHNVEFKPSLDLVSQIIKNLSIPANSKTDLGDGNYIWKNNEVIVLYTSERDTVDIQFLKPPSQGTGFKTDEVNLKTLDIIKKLIPQTDFIVSNINYYKDENPDPKVVDPSASKIAQIGFNQIINNIPVIPDKLSNRNTVFLTIDSSFSPRFISIQKIIQNSLPTQKTISYDPSSLKQINPSLVSRLTPLPIATENSVKQSSDNEFKVTNIQTAYAISGNKITPIIILDGDIVNKGYSFGKASYAAPIPSETTDTTEL